MKIDSIFLEFVSVNFGYMYNCRIRVIICLLVALGFHSTSSVAAVPALPLRIEEEEESCVASKQGMLIVEPTPIDDDHDDHDGICILHVLRDHFYFYCKGVSHKMNVTDIGATTGCACILYRPSSSLLLCTSAVARSYPFAGTQWRHHRYKIGGHSPACSRSRSRHQCLPRSLQPG